MRDEREGVRRDSITALPLLSTSTVISVDKVETIEIEVEVEIGKESSSMKKLAKKRIFRIEL